MITQMTVRAAIPGILTGNRMIIKASVSSRKKLTVEGVNPFENLPLSRPEKS
jgi:hypothetical protein